jgi:hypothetical protein
MIQLAFNNPEPRIFAIDYSGSDSTMCPDQMEEQPNTNRVEFFMRTLFPLFPFLISVSTGLI